MLPVLKHTYDSFTTIWLLITLLVNCFYSFSQNKTIETTGDVILFTAPVATVAATLLFDDSEGSCQFTKSVTLSSIITYGLKLTINKSRPDASNENSFPSGHTSVTFQAASFIHKRYGFKKSIPFYALAGFTAFSRIHAKKHDFWDILVGAFIGIGSSYLFTTPYQKKKLNLSFLNNNNNYLIGFKYKF
ncbi:phosphatase PAP2 family protein [Flavivirga rizhaonensis]|uniref:Phosphatase PAP2 family protein n=1 Tax=Flavivirga rizhaonensis TaxID=2559571 RepID=A0A4S1E347_9FLAO|nr:phosphatase PAP2 family protein [Flavivirga rizhaonensis]TGV04865.1 phosphatase PAP2 family protein [Flavivirga rizhaonensis]